MSATQVDESKIDDILNSLGEKQAALQAQMTKIRIISTNLSKIKSRIVSTTIIAGSEPVQVMGKPLDNDLGVDVEMADDKRLAIYNANIALAAEVLS